MKSSDSQSKLSQVRRHETDVGSPEAQIAIKTERLAVLSSHVSANPNDVHSRRGLRRLVSERNRTIAYLKKVNPESYKSVISTLGLRK